MKFCMHLSTRIQDKRKELSLLNCMTDLALEADKGGFGAISLTEHHLHENQGYQNSLLFACALAPRLTQATLVLATVNPALHHPVRLVESCNLIDQLNAGRLVVVFGSGFKETDLVAFGRDLAKRNELFEQGMRTVLDIWKYDGTGGPLEFAVGADRGRLDTAVNPSSFRKSRPILGRGTLNPASIADTAARGWPVFTAIRDAASARERMAAYHTALAASGHDAETVAIAREWSGVGKAVHVAETDEQARSEAEAFFAKNPSGGDRAQRRRHDHRQPRDRHPQDARFCGVRCGIDDLRLPHRPRQPAEASSQRPSVRGTRHPGHGGVKRSGGIPLPRHFTLIFVASKRP